MKTSALDPYFFSFHKRDIGHTLIVGPTGGGKTVIVNFLMAQAEKTSARQIFVDKERGAQIFVLASGDRKSVVEGKSVSVGVEPGVGRVLKKKTREKSKRQEKCYIQ